MCHIWCMPSAYLYRICFYIHAQNFAHIPCIASFVSRIAPFHFFIHFLLRMSFSIHNELRISHCCEFIVLYLCLYIQFVCMRRVAFYRLLGTVTPTFHIRSLVLVCVPCQTFPKQISHNFQQSFPFLSFVTYVSWHRRQSMLLLNCFPLFPTANTHIAAYQPSIAFISFIARDVCIYSVVYCICTSTSVQRTHAILMQENN